MSNILSGLAIGGTTGAAFILADVITGGSAIGLQEAFTVGASVCGLVWWMGRKFQGIEDDIRLIKRKLDLDSKSDEP
jgi:hypothetical protein